METRSLSMIILYAAVFLSCVRWNGTVAFRAYIIRFRYWFTWSVDGFSYWNTMPGDVEGWSRLRGDPGWACELAYCTQKAHFARKQDSICRRNRRKVEGGGRKEIGDYCGDTLNFIQRILRMIDFFFLSLESGSGQDGHSRCQDGKDRRSVP